MSSVTSRSGLAGTPRLSQIPPRSSISGSFQHPRSIASDLAIERTSTPPPHSDADIGGKAAIASTSQGKSALTVALGKVADSGKEPAPPSPNPGTPELPSGSATPLRPDESAFSTLADVPDEEKARVLRRHLVSAEERTGSGSKVATPGANDSPAEGSQAGDSAVVSGAEDPFPIPYDAPGGDVT